MAGTQFEAAPRPTRSELLLLHLEFIIAVVGVTLFGAIFPQKFRFHLWENGGEHGWCSNPKHRVLDTGASEVPLIWSQKLATSNLALAVLTMAVFIVRVVLLRARRAAHATNLTYDILLVLFWALSAISQCSGDMSDHEHPMEKPWYLEHGCDGAWPSNRPSCRLFRAAYIWTMITTMFYFAKVVCGLFTAAYNHEHDALAIKSEKERARLINYDGNYDGTIGGRRGGEVTLEKEPHKVRRLRSEGQHWPGEEC